MNRNETFSGVKLYSARNTHLDYIYQQKALSTKVLFPTQSLWKDWVAVRHPPQQRGTDSVRLCIRESRPCYRKVSSSRVDSELRVAFKCLNVKMFNSAPLPWLEAFKCLNV